MSPSAPTSTSVTATPPMSPRLACTPDTSTTVPLLPPTKSQNQLRQPAMASPTACLIDIMPAPPTPSSAQSAITKSAVITYPMQLVQPSSPPSTTWRVSENLGTTPDASTSSAITSCSPAPSNTNVLGAHNKDEHNNTITRSSSSASSSTTKGNQQNRPPPPQLVASILGAFTTLLQWQTSTRTSLGLPSTVGNP